MKTKLLSLAMAVLGTPILAHATTTYSAPYGYCTYANPAAGVALILVNAALSSFGVSITC